MRSQVPRPVLSLIALMATCALFYAMHLLAENPDFPVTVIYALIAFICALCGVQYADFRSRRRDEKDDRGGGA